MTDEATFRERWFRYGTEKRIGQQWMQLELLRLLEAQRVLEVGPAFGLVTALLDNAGYDVTTLDLVAAPFARPQLPHLTMDLLRLDPAALRGFDAILCCETLEHLPWEAAPAVLRGFAASGARHLILSVPYEGLQLAIQLYLNPFTARLGAQLKKLRFLKAFRPGPDPLGHKWEIGYRGRSVAAWESAIAGSGWRIRERRFTTPCRSIFHVCDNVSGAAAAPRALPPATDRDRFPGA